MGLFGKKNKKALNIEEDFKKKSIVFNHYRDQGEKPVLMRWYDGEVNFGDLVSLRILFKEGYHPINLVSAQRAQLLCVGSVLQSIDESFDGYVLGSGLIKPDVNIPDISSRIISVRGPKTEKIACPGKSRYGDLGLVFNDYCDVREEKKFKLGIVPHIVDQGVVEVNNLVSRNKDVCFIDVMQDPVQVLKEISACEYIASSSLHGLIFADSVGIPNVRFIASGKVKGGDFKFNDYNESINHKKEVICLDRGYGVKEILDASSMASPEKVNFAKSSIKESIKLFNNIYESDIYFRVV